MQGIHCVGVEASAPVLLVLGVGEGGQHVGQGGEGQIQPIHVMLAEDRHPHLGIARDGALGGLQSP